jgi:hypothetical protein
LTVSFEHHECRALIGKPTEGGERNKPIVANHNQSAQAVSYTRKPILIARCAYAVGDNEVPAIHAHIDSVTEESEDAVPQLW